MKQSYFLLVFSILCLNTIRSQNSNALNFDGIDDYVSAPLPSIFSNIQGNDFTIEAWIFSSQYVAFDNLIFAQFNSANFVTIGLTTAPDLNTNQISFYIQNGAGILSTAFLPINQWHHVAATWNSATNRAQIYVNGVLGFTTPTTFTIRSDSGNSMILGSRISRPNFFNGTIDELRIWSTVRTASEINANMNDELSLPQANLVTYYKFNQGQAGLDNSGITTLQDELNLNNGNLNNFALNGDVSNWVGATNILSVSDFTNNSSSVKLFPNPVKDFIQISGLKNIIDYKVYSQLGQEVMSGKVYDTSIIHIQLLSKGMYLLELENGNRIKFIKE